MTEPTGEADAGGYRHRQFATGRYLILLVIMLVPVLAMVLSDGHPLALVAALLVLAVAAVSHSLTIELDDEVLSWSFRPVIGRWRLPVGDIVRVQAEPVGWEAHLGLVKLRRGWLYAAAPGEAVAIVTADGREIFLGTDDAAGLLKALRAVRQPAVNRQP